MPLGCYKQMSFIKKGVIMRLQCNLKFMDNKQKVTAFDISLA